MRIIPLKEGDFLVTPNKEFIALHEAQGLKGLYMAFVPFLVITKSEYILIDAGIGWKDELGNSKVCSILKANGIEPVQINKVLCSHLHKDHILGLFNEGKLTFPNARIYVQEREFDYAIQQYTDPAYDTDLLKVLQEEADVEWLNEDFGFINSEICYEMTGGHSPYHQVFWIRNANEIVFYGGDNLPQRSYLDVDIAYKSDYDGHRAMDLRSDWKRQIKDECWRVLLYHEMGNPII